MKQNNSTLGSQSYRNRDLYSVNGIFANHYIELRIKGSELIAPDYEIAVCYDRCKSLFEEKSELLWMGTDLSEDQTRDELISPALQILGFKHISGNVSPGPTQQIPDYLLFEKEEEKLAAYKKDPKDRYPLALAFLEAKALHTDLDSKTRSHRGFPYQQVEDYLYEAKSKDGTPHFNWGILTDGVKWRLYSRDAYAADHFEMTLPRALVDLKSFKLFYVFFSPAAFRRDSNRLCRLDYLRKETLSRQVELENDLRRRIFALVELLANGIEAKNSLQTEQLKELYDHCLIFLYRLLFVLYAESRNLLPVSRRGNKTGKFYRENFSLQRLIGEYRRIEEEGYESEEEDDVFDHRYSEIFRLFELINGSSPAQNKRLNIPQYNGGLFDPESHPRFREWIVGDYTLNTLLKGLLFKPVFTAEGETVKVDFDEAIDYADLDVRQLGSIYEGLLEYHLEEFDGILKLVEDKKDRKSTGSFYTPEYVVDYIVRNTVNPHLERIERTDDVQKAVAGESKDNSFALEALKLKILDPAMGSGHFLVKATKYLTAKIVEHPTTHSLNSLEAEGDSPGLKTVAFWRRKVVENCIYGVDLNPLAVELAKLSLWLTCIASDKPLNFLDHHIRCGNSLIGSNIGELDHLQRHKENTGSLFKLEGVQEELKKSVEYLDAIDRMEANELSDIKRMQTIWEKEVQRRLVHFRAVADLHAAFDLGLDIEDEAYVELARSLLRLKKEKPSQSLHKKYDEILKKQAELKEKHNFFHWELEFPDVFAGDEKERGFDIVFGNPPYGAKLADAEKRFINKRFISFNYRYESYIYFIESGINLLKKNGYMSLITPEIWLNLDFAQPIRELIKEKANLIKIKLCGEKVFPDAIVNTIIFVLRQELANGELKIEYNGNKYIIPSTFWESDPNLRISYKTIPLVKSLVEKTRSNRTMPLSALGEIIQGITAYDKYSGQTEKVIKNRAYHYSEKIDASCERWLTGKDISRYAIRWSGEWIRYGDWLAAPRDPKFFDGDRILIREIPGEKKRLQAAFVSDVIYHGHSIIPFKPYSSDRKRLLVLLAIINSKLISWYGNYVWPNFGKNIYPKVNPKDIKQLPIVKIDKKNKKIWGKIEELEATVEKIIDLSDQRKNAKPKSQKQKLQTQIENLDAEIDRLVYQLYGLTDEEIQIVEDAFR